MDRRRHGACGGPTPRRISAGRRWLKRQGLLDGQNRFDRLFEGGISQADMAIAPGDRGLPTDTVKGPSTIGAIHNRFEAPKPVRHVTGFA